MRRCFSGQIFDSSPIDFLSKLGVRFLAPPGAPAWQGAAWRGAAVALDLVLGRDFEARLHSCAWKASSGFADFAQLRNA